MPPTQPPRTPVARFLATSRAWLRGSSARSRDIDDAHLVTVRGRAAPDRPASGGNEPGRPDHDEPMGERELIAHRRRLRALWIAQWQASLQQKLRVARVD